MNRDYIELHCHSTFSIRDGASTPDELVTCAREVGMEALALTDHDAVYGAPQFVKAAAAQGIRPLFGSELTLPSGHHLTLLVKNEIGWGNLCELIRAGRHNAPKGDARLPEGALENHNDGLIALSGCRKGVVPQALLRRDRQAARKAASDYARLFGRGNFWIELQHHLRPDDNRLVAELVELAGALSLGYVATNNVHYANRERHRLQDVMTAMRLKTTLDEASLYPNSEQYLKPYDELAPLFAAYPDALTNTRHIAEQCDFQLRYGLQELPIFPTPSGMNADTYLRFLCDTGAQQRGLVNVDDHLAYELEVIRQSGLSNYFLIVWDMVRFARENGILCQGRGSAANSLVAYLLDISPINPIEHNLVFERFLSTERRAVPDIDIDFDAARREEVIQYIYNRYGLEHAAMACTFVTFHARSAVREVGKAIGLPLDLLEHVTTTLDVFSPQNLGESVSLQEALGGQISTQTWQQVIELSQEIDGHLNYIGLHNGGMVTSGIPLSQRVPTEPATMAERYVVQWDKEGLEEIGLVKIDILGLRMLSAITESVELVGQMTGQKPDLSRLTFDDPTVYDMICCADTIGVFQVESRAQAQVLPRLKPRCFADLVICISLIRPGPIQGDMVHPYLRRRDGLEPITYFHPLLEPVLKQTLGVVLFQEQVLLVARDLAGFTPGQGELLRRALGAKNPGMEIERLREAFIAGALQKGVEAETAELVFDKLRAFGGYSFAKSHAASFAVPVYWSAWLKHYYPLAFAIAILNNSPMGFWSPGIVANDARRHGISVLNVDVHHSQSRCVAEAGGLRLGFNYVDGFTEPTGEMIVQARGMKPFRDLADFYKRTKLPTNLVENLIQAGAFQSGDISKRKLLWTFGTLQRRDSALDLTFPTTNVHLPELSPAEEMGMEYATTGIATGPHPMALFREQLSRRGILSSTQLNSHPEKQLVWAAGKKEVLQQPPTAKGILFMTLEDEDGFLNVIVRPQVYTRFRRTIRGSALLMVQGRVKRIGAVTNLVATKVVSLSEILAVRGG
jgi:error-prone DNA polymerase